MWKATSKPEISTVEFVKAGSSLLLCQVIGILKFVAAANITYSNAERECPKQRRTCESPKCKEEKGLLGGSKGSVTPAEEKGASCKTTPVMQAWPRLKLVKDLS